MGMKRTSYSRLAVITAALITLFLAAAPAVAHHKDDHKGGPPGQSKGHGGQSKDHGGQSKDHDGDADSDPATSHEDGHAAEEGVDDNQHPSGKDKSAEHGNSGNQGKSESDPDNNGRGPDRCAGYDNNSDRCGTDKPGGSGGADEDDQDGNNGCGNDDDFDDDNEGWCGKPEKPAESQPSDESAVAAIDVTNPPSAEGSPKGEVSGSGVSNDQPASAQASGSVESASQEAAPSASGTVLPFTGDSARTFLTLALVLIACGVLITAFSRSNSQ
jgi:hypothetical protein